VRFIRVVAAPRIPARPNLNTRTMTSSHSTWRLTALCGKLTLVTGLLLALFGCATMSPEECLTADWYEKGVRDGMNGQPRSYIEEHREACSKAGVIPNAALWQKGRSQGIERYCTPENGLNAGRRGQYYRNACPPELEPDFLANYRAGYRVYESQQRVERLASEQRRKQYQLDREKDDKKRDRVRRQLRDLDYRLRGARDDLYYEERRLYR